MKKDSVLVSAWKGLPGQLKGIRFVLPAYVLLVLVMFFLVWIVSSKYDIEFDMFTRDISTLAGMHPIYGLFSTLGMFFWASAAAICFFVYFMYRRHLGNNRRSFLLTTAFVMLGLLLDDVFEVHEFMVPFHLNIPQEYVYATYIFLILAYTVYFIRSILETEYLLFLLASLFIGISVGLDFLADSFGKEFPPALEDGMKFFGVGLWLLYCIRICAGTVRTLLQEDVVKRDP